MGMQDEAARKSIDFGTNLMNTTTEGIKNAIELLLRMLELKSDNAFKKELDKIFDPEMRKPDVRKVSEFAMSDVKQQLDANDICNKLVYAKNADGDSVPFLLTLPTQRKEIDALIDDMYIKQKNVSRIRYDSFFTTKNKGKKLFSVNLNKEQAKLVQQEAKHLGFVLSLTKTDGNNYRVSVLENDYNKLVGALSVVIPDSLDIKGQVKDKYFKVWNDEIEKSKLLLSSDKEFYVISSTTYIGENFDKNKVEHIHVKDGVFTHKKQDIQIRSEDKNFSYDFENIYDMQLESIKEPIVLTKDEFESPNIQNIIKEKKNEKKQEIKNVIEESNFDISFDKNIRALVQYRLLFKDELNSDTYDISKKDYVDGKVSTEEFLGFNEKSITFLTESGRLDANQIEILKEGIKELEDNENVRDDFFEYLNSCNEVYEDAVLGIESTEITYEQIKERTTIDELIKNANELDANIEEFDWEKTQEKE